jgi:hypothetical protein
MEERCSPHGRQEAQRGKQEGTRVRYKPKDASSEIHFLQVGPHLLKFPALPKIAPLAKDQAFI